MLGQGHRAPPGVELPVHSGQLHGGLPVEQGADTGRRCTRGSRTRALNRGDPLHHTAGRHPLRQVSLVRPEGRRPARGGRCRRAFSKEASSAAAGAARAAKVTIMRSPDVVSILRARRVSWRRACRQPGPPAAAGLGAGVALPLLRGPGIPDSVGSTASCRTGPGSGTGLAHWRVCPIEQADQVVVDALNVSRLQNEGCRQVDGLVDRALCGALRLIEPLQFACDIRPGCGKRGGQPLQCIDQVPSLGHQIGPVTFAVDDDRFGDARPPGVFYVQVESGARGGRASLRRRVKARGLRIRHQSAARSGRGASVGFVMASDPAYVIVGHAAWVSGACPAVGLRLRRRIWSAWCLGGVRGTTCWQGWCSGCLR